MANLLGLRDQPGENSPNQFTLVTANDQTEIAIAPTYPDPWLVSLVEVSPRLGRGTRASRNQEEPAPIQIGPDDGHFVIIVAIRGRRVIARDEAENRNGSQAFNMLQASEFLWTVLSPTSKISEYDGELGVVLVPKSKFPVTPLLGTLPFCQDTAGCGLPFTHYLALNVIRSKV